MTDEMWPESGFSAAAPVGAEFRRGPFREGDRVQLTDPKGKLHTIVLGAGKAFHTHRGYFQHDELIGKPEGSVVTATSGMGFVAFRPLLADHVLSMPRGAAVIYPKDAGQIVAMADIFPGARVVEAGVGSGALTMSLLRAVGDGGELHSIERREDFADIARLNVENFFGGVHPAWQLHVGDFADRVAQVAEPGTVDRIVLDMLAPWENIDAAATALRPGGVFVAYIATTTQLSRVAETLRADGRFTEPQAWETMLRTWHLEGLAVRPDHRMVGHTGFLLSARRLADGVVAPERRRRPSSGMTAEGQAGDVADTGETPADSYDHEALAGIAYAEGEWTPEALGERPVSEKKIRRVRRDLRG